MTMGSQMNLLTIVVITGIILAVAEARMINIRKSDDRGHADHGWLDTHFTFSFADYYDPKHVQFRTLSKVVVRALLFRTSIDRPVLP